MNTTILRQGKRSIATLAIGLTVLMTSASMLHAATYYVDINGVDGSGRNGGSSQPWKTPSYAATRVTTAGDIIHVNAGTFSDGATVNLALGVNIRGAGQASTVINATVASDYILLKTDGDCVNGNQKVHDLTINGSGKVTQAVHTMSRNNVEIFNVTATNCTGTIIYGRVWTGNTWMTGYKVHDCIVKGTGPSNGQLLYGIMFWQTSGAQIYNNTVELHYGCAMGGLNVKGANVYGNTLSTWGVQTGYQNEWFAFWMRFWSDDCDIHDNWLNNGLSCENGNGKGAGTYAAKFRNNKIVFHDFGNYAGADLGMELSSEDILVEGNYIAYASMPISVGYMPLKNIVIRQNVFLMRGGGYGCILSGSSTGTKPAGPSSDVQVYNNVFDVYKRHPTDFSQFLLRVTSGTSDFNGLSIRNNAFIGSVAYGQCIAIAPVSASTPSALGGGTYNNVQITHNLYPNIDPTHAVFISDPGNKLAGATVNNNTKAAPGLNVSGAVPSPYYAPASGSSFCVDRGVNVGLPYSGAAPDIGAYEYQPPVITLPHRIRIDRLQSSDGFWYRLDGRFLRTCGHEQYPGLQLRKVGGSDGGSVAHLTLEKHH